MLNRKDRKRVRSEEIYRSEVRRQLADVDVAALGKSSRLLRNVWRVLNSQVGGWLLSTVLLGSVAWAYSEWWLPRQEAAAAKKSVLSEVQFRLDVAERIPNRDAAIKELNRGRAFDPRHDGRDMGALLWELGSLNGNLEVMRRYALYFRLNPTIAPPDFKDQLDCLRQEIGPIAEN